MIESKSLDCQYSNRAIQDYYPRHLSFCFGCGRNNRHGLHTRTYWDDFREIGICRFTPRSHHCGYRGALHGGLILSVIECNSVATSIAAKYAQEKRPIGENPLAHLFTLVKIDARFSKPVPIDASEVIVETKVLKLGRIAKCKVSVFADGRLCSTADTITMHVPNEVVERQFLR
jgi:acyl-coenzyme A thioesterase PaaI-like protein